MMAALPPSPDAPHPGDDLFRQDSSRAGPSRLPVTGGLTWENGTPCVRMQDAVVETVVTHVTRTTTSFAPLPLPRIPSPESIPLPTHLPTVEYPLAALPTPEDMKFFPLNLGGRRVVIQEEGYTPQSKEPGQGGEPGWTRNFLGVDKLGGNDVERIDLFNALELSKGKEARKRPHNTYHTTGRPYDRPQIPTPPVHEMSVGVGGPTPHRSPPRKRVRGLENVTMPHQDGPLLSPLPSPDPEVPPALPAVLPSSAGTSPSIGSGHEIAALYSLPSIISHFDAMPDKLQQHVLMQLLRRSRMPTIQRISDFAATALRRDFISALPHELAVQILAKVDVGSLAQASRVNRKWRQMIDSERAIWKQRLIDDDLWCGLGVEEEEERSISRRYDIMDEQARMRNSLAEEASEDEDMVESGPASRFDRPVPLKHVYRRRWLSNKSWFTGEPEHISFQGHGSTVVTCLQFDAERIISASDDNHINVYDTRTGQLRKRLEGHEGGVWALQFKGDTLVTGSTDRSLRIWDLETLTQTHVFGGHNSTVRCLQIVEPVLNEKTGEYEPPCPLIVTGSRDCSVRVWRLPKKGEQTYRSYVNGVEVPVLPDQNPYHLMQLKGHSSAIRALAAHGRIVASGSYDNTVRVWDIIKGVCLHTLTGHEQRVYSVVFDPHRMRCASGSMDNTVKVWDLKTGECLSTLTGHTSLVGLLDISPNHIVSAAADSSLRVWDAETRDLRQILATNGGAITCFQHDEYKMVSGSEGMLKMWDIRKGYYVRDLVIGISSVWQVAFSGNVLVAASNRQGNIVFDVFDFGKIRHCSGVDNDGLDKLRLPPWELYEQQQLMMYPSDDMDVEGTSPGLFGGPSTSASISELLSTSKSKRGKGVDRRSRRSTRLASKAASSSQQPPHVHLPPLPLADPSTPTRVNRKSGVHSTRSGNAQAGPSNHRLEAGPAQTGHTETGTGTDNPSPSRARYALGPPRTRRSARNRVLSTSPSPAGPSSRVSVQPRPQIDSLPSLRGQLQLQTSSRSRTQSQSQVQGLPAGTRRRKQSLSATGQSFAPIVAGEEEDGAEEEVEDDEGGDNLGGDEGSETSSVMSGDESEESDWPRGEEGVDVAVDDVD